MRFPSRVGGARGGGATAARPLLRLLLALQLALVASPAFGDWYWNYDDAKKAMAAQNWDKAAKLLEAAIREKPASNAKARTSGTNWIAYYPHYYLGLCYLNLGRYQEAVQAFDREEGYRQIQSSQEGYARLVEDRKDARARLGPREEPPKPAPPPAIDTYPVALESAKGAIVRADALLARSDLTQGQRERIERRRQAVKDVLPPFQRTTEQINSATAALTAFCDEIERPPVPSPKPPEPSPPDPVRESIRKVRERASDLLRRSALKPDQRSRIDVAQKELVALLDRSYATPDRIIAEVASFRRVCDDVEMELAVAAARTAQAEAGAVLGKQRIRREEADRIQAEKRALQDLLPPAGGTPAQIERAAAALGHTCQAINLEIDKRLEPAPDVKPPEVILVTLPPAARQKLAGALQKAEQGRYRDAADSLRTLAGEASVSAFAAMIHAYAGAFYCTAHILSSEKDANLRELATKEFRAALEADSTLQLKKESFSPRVIEVFRQVQK